MTIGLVLHSEYALESVRFVARDLVRHLSLRHELRFLPAEYAFACARRRDELAERFVRECDVLVGFHSTVDTVLAARARCGARVPCMLFLLGALPRGGLTFRSLFPHLVPEDRLVASCAADVALAELLFRDAVVELLPFSYDATHFFPIPEDSRRAVRLRLGFSPADRVLLYAGRITLEKNVHTVLRVFSVLQRRHPGLRLILAGPISDDPFREFGVAPANLRGLLARATRRLGIPAECVRLMRPSSPGQLRLLYSAADLLVNLTLHHDENFGLAQVEAMACGTPVVGTLWGGLKDTIEDGVSGFGVSTVLTPAGVKVSWWEAVSRILELIEDETLRQRMADSSVQIAKSRYGSAAYAERLEAAIQSIATPSCNDRPRLEPSRFARELWTHHGASGAAYHPRSRSFELYRTLITTYTGQSALHVPSGAPLEPDQVVSLTSGVQQSGSGALTDDPLFPFQVELPITLQRDVTAITELMRNEPTMTVGRLACLLDCSPRTSAEAVGWMLDAGLLLRSCPSRSSLRPEEVDGRIVAPLFSDVCTALDPPRLLVY
jgi:glycosyltransferase involved in cell wall biosynthesis